MSEKTEVQEIEKILEGLDVYLRKLSWFPGNAALKWLADSASRTQDVASDRKQVLKNAREMIKYIDDLPWAASNAAMRHIKDELKKCMQVYNVEAEEPKPAYDDPNPQPTVESKPAE